MPSGDEHRREGEAPKLLDPRRSAHASIRGYLYQTCLGVLRWLDLQPDETLLVEGDEDLDRFLLDGGSVSEQVKAYTGEVSITDRVIRESLHNFLRSYVALRRRGEARRFLFTTTAQQRGQRRSAWNFDLLEAWEKGIRTPEMFAAVRSLLQAGGGHSGKEEIEGALAWLDAQQDGWKSFLDAVEWSFGAPDVDGIRRKIGDRLAIREDTRLLPGDIFRERLIFEVLQVSSRKEPRDRTLTAQDLLTLAEQAKADLGNWAATPAATRIRVVFEELGQVNRLLYDGAAELPPSSSAGKLLTAAYEVIPFDEIARRKELDCLASWCDSPQQRNVLLLTGEGGSGKTRLMIEWCRRLSHQGWHAGFLRRDRDHRDLDPLLEGSAPRLVVVDYAETLLAVVHPLLLKMAMASQGEGPKLRLVLLSRTEANWWDSVTRKDREVEDLLKSSHPLRENLLPVPKDVEERRKAFRSAVEGFSQYLRQGIPTELSTPDFIRKDFERVLYLHMAALAALHGKPIESADHALAEILAHERRFWDRQVCNEIPDNSLAVDVREALTCAVTALTLVGGAGTAEQARVLLERVLKPFSLPPYRIQAIIRLLRNLYGGAAQENGLYLNPLLPSLLGEELVASVLFQDEDLLRRILDGSTPEDDYSTLRVLLLLARRRPELDLWLGVALKYRPDLYKLVLDIGVDTGDPVGWYWRRP